MEPAGEGGRTRRGRRDLGAEAFAVSPFMRLARTHALSVAGDTLLAIALADSLFFAVDPNDARWRVGAYLLLTIAPFAVVAPFLGPVMDRVTGGHRYMIIGTAFGRAMLMAALVFYVQDWPLFPLAFAMLVMGKTYAVAKSAVVPSTVANDEVLVRSNSRLSILSAVSGAVAGIPGVILLQLGGAPSVLAFGVLVFLVAAFFAFRIPATKVASKPEEQAEREELRSAGILVASSAMGYLRGAVGFVTMLLAFSLRGGIDPGPQVEGVEIGHRVRESLGLERLDLTSGGAPPWHFGVALIGVGIGGLLGSGGVPKLRARLAEERILAYGLISLTALAALAAVSTGLAGAFVMSFGIALAAQGSKQAFDAIVQRDAPRANLGRTFSRYESRFQLVWVFGALIPVIIPMGARLGFVLVAISAAFVAATYWFGRTPNPAAILSDGIVADGLDRLAGVLPGRMGERLADRTWGRAVDDPGAPGANAADRHPDVDRTGDPVSGAGDDPGWLGVGRPSRRARDARPSRRGRRSRAGDHDVGRGDPGPDDAGSDDFGSDDFGSDGFGDLDPGRPGPGDHDPSPVGRPPRKRPGRRPETATRHDKTAIMPVLPDDTALYPEPPELPESRRSGGPGADDRHDERGGSPLDPPSEPGPQEGDDERSVPRPPPEPDSWPTRRP